LKKKIARSDNDINQYKEEIQIVQDTLKNKIQELLIKNHFVKIEEKKESDNTDTNSEMTTNTE